MSTPDPLIDHLQQNSSRIARMLSPGKKSDQAQSPANFSPVAADFAGRKFQLAAKKMQILNPERMGHVLPADKARMGAEIKSRFAHVDQLLHLPTKSAGASSGWSKVDMTIPRGGASEKPQASNDPGMMRAGSVIPKMSTFPKPGQSLGSFKDQVQSIQPARKAAPIIPRLSPRDRLFTQVQEITPGSSDNDKKADSGADSTPPAASPTANSTVQRQPDTRQPGPPAKASAARQAAQEAIRPVEPGSTPESIRPANGPKPAAPSSSVKPENRSEGDHKASPKLQMADDTSRPSETLESSSDSLEHKPGPLDMPLAQNARTQEHASQAPVKPADAAPVPARLAQVSESPAISPAAGPVNPEKKADLAEKLSAALPARPEPKVEAVGAAKSIPESLPLEKQAPSQPRPASAPETVSQAKPEGFEHPALPVDKTAASSPRLEARTEEKAEDSEKNPSVRFSQPQDMPLARPSLPSETGPRQLEKPEQPARPTLEPPENRLPLAVPVKSELPDAGANQGIQARHPAAPAAQPAPRKKLSAPKTPRLPVARPTLTAPEDRLPLAVPVKSELPEAGPNQGTQARHPAAPTAQPAPRKKLSAPKAPRLPVARPTRNASAAHSGGSSVVQRQIDSKPAPTAPQAGVSTDKGSAPESAARVGSGRPASKPEAQPENVSLSTDSAPTRPEEGPLQKHIEYRQQAPLQLRSIQPANRVVTPHVDPSVSRPREPLVKPSKYLPPGPKSAEAETSSPALGENLPATSRPPLAQPQTPEIGSNRPPASKLAAALPAAMASPSRVDGPKPISAPRMDLSRMFPVAPAGLRPQTTYTSAVKPAPMELARPPKPPEPAREPSRKPEPVGSKPDQPSMNAPQQSTPMPPAQKNSSSNLIQRVMDDDNDGSGADDNQSSGGSELSSQINLADMAEKILPIVKRMLQIEAERSGRLFR